jgi:omega-amidase
VSDLTRGVGDGTPGTPSTPEAGTPRDGTPQDGTPAPDLRVTLVEVPLVWENPDANREALARLLRPLQGLNATDLVVLPEMFTTGFSLRSTALAEPPDGPTVAWMLEMAKGLGAALFGSLIVRDGDRHLNRGVFVTPEGEVTAYDKRHLFRMAREDASYDAGSERVVTAWRGWRLLLQICYDLRFPVFSRNRGDYDAILYVANWPAPRRLHWKRLLAARAIENLAYAVGVNRVGMDGNGLAYSGDSGVYDVHGERLPLTHHGPPGTPVHPDSSGEAREEEGGEAGPRIAEGRVVTAVLRGEDLRAHRARFPAHLDADGFVLT